MLVIISEGNLGMVQMFFLRCLEKEKNFINANVVINVFPSLKDIPSDEEWKKEWDNQKINGSNAVDIKELWSLVYQGNTIAEAVKKIRERI